MADKKTVVVVEDDEDMREVIVRTFRRDNAFEVIATATDARQAVDVVRTHQPELVVLDHYIDGRVMGLESVPIIKTVAPETKLIVFTQKDLGMEAYFEPEVDAYLRKDDLDRLLGVARELLKLDRAH